MSILKCDCKHEYQDQKYGKGMRVHNTKKKGKDGNLNRCTVCQRTR